MTDALHTALTDLTQDNLALRRALDDIVAFATQRARQLTPPTIAFRCGHTTPVPPALPYLCLDCGLETLNTAKRAPFVWSDG